MARFCTQCGSPVGDEMSFCMNCGAKTAAPPSAPAASQPVAAGPVPMAPAGPAAPATVPAKKTSPVVKIILAVVAFFIFLTVAGIGACVYIGYRARRAVNEIKQGETSIKIPTSEGDIKIGGHPTEKGGAIAGVPVYPGATALQGGGQFSFGDKLQIGGQDYETSDSVDQVVDFYKEKLGSKLSVAENAGHYRLAVETGDEKRSGVVTIDVFEDEQTGKTKITIAHLGGMKAQ
jgi:hypothetical protein